MAINSRNYFSLLNSIVLAIWLWLTGIFSTFSQGYIFDTEVINVEDGLPHRMVYDVVQDKQGFIWVSTVGTISRYDGYGFKTYSQEFLGISEGRTAHLAIDVHNRLWYCSTINNNIRNPRHSAVIDTQRDSIYTMTYISEGRFSAEDVIYVANPVSGQDDVLIATRTGVIYKYDGTFEEVYRFPQSLVGNVNVKAASDGGYWIFSDSNTKELIKVKNGKKQRRIPVKSMYFVNAVAGQPYEAIVSPADVPDVGYKYRIWKKGSLVPLETVRYIPDKPGRILQLHENYTCYANDAIQIYDTQGTLIYTFDDFEFSGKAPFKSKAILLDKDNTLWIATNNGLFKITVRKNPFNLLEKGNSIRGIFKKGKRLWTGGYFGNTIPGISDQIAKKYLPNRTIMSFYEDHRGHLLMAMNRGTLMEYIPSEEKYIPYEFNCKCQFYLTFQNAVTKTYWGATESGFFRLDMKNRKISRYPLPTGPGKLEIRQCYQNAEGIWIVSNQGLFLMDAKKETILKHYTTADGLPGNNINHIHEDREGIFWFGTKGDGLVRWDIQNNTFRQYTREDGLSNNTIYAVYEDDFETLWLPSNYGLMAFDKNTQITKVYLPQNGIAHEEFNTFAHFRDTDGTLYFGGLNGITRFHPEDLRKEKAVLLPLYATHIRVLEKDAGAFSDRTAAYNTTKKITMDPGDQIIEVEFTLLDYKNSGEKQYAYKLAGQQEQWIYTTNNKISIINPPYGRYNLVIKARSASGQWSDEILTIPLYVQTPFYLRWWFFVAVFMVLSGGVFAAMRWRVQKLEKDRKRLEGEVQKRTQKIARQAEALKALDEAKTRFFANITHEFRTPLTLIIGPAEQLLKTGLSQTVKAKIQSMKRNSKQLLGLINQLLDLAKLENKGMSVEVSHGDIVRYTKELLKSFQSLLVKKGLLLHFNCPFQRWETNFDAGKWDKILYNLLSNAIKFTAQGGSITIDLQKLQESGRDIIQLQVADTGVGIEADKLSYIFDRFYQADASSTRMQEGTGIGLALVKELVELQNGSVHVESAVGKGTVFTITLPVAREVTVNPLATSVPEAETFPRLPIEVETKAVPTDKVQEKATTGKLDLLIVEDNAEMRGYIRSCIDESTYRITEAENGETGIRKAQEIVPDLIISDVMMPKKDGFELTRAVRSHIATSHIPLILLTAKASLESRLKGFERGADAYLTKPFSSVELALRIQKMIALRQLLKQRYQSHESPEENTTFKKEDAFIGKLRSYIVKNISDPDLNGERISSHFAMSRMQLHRKLKTLTNTSISDFVRSIRLHIALRLLKERKLNISEIAYETGFSSPSNFSKFFKKIYGKSPSRV